MADETVVVEKPVVEQVSIGTLPMKEYKEARAKGETTIEVQKEAPIKEPEVKNETEEEEEKPTGKFRKRYDNLFKQTKSLEAQLAEEKKARLELEARVNGKTSTEPPKEAAKTTDGAPKMEDFKDLDEYISAKTRWEMKQIEKENSERSEKEASEARTKQITETFKQRTEEAKERYPDYVEAMSQDMEVPTVILAPIMEMDNGPDVAYHLAKHPEIREKLMTLTPMKAVAEVIRIADKLAAESAPAEEEKEPEKIVTKAPAPIKTVGGTSSRSSVPLDKMSMDQYKKARKAGRVN